MKYVRNIIIIIIVLYYISPDTYYLIKNKISNNLPDVKVSVVVDDKKYKDYNIMNKGNVTHSDHNIIMNKDNNTIKNFSYKDFE